VDLKGHLTFALKYEGVDLAVMKRLFEAAGPRDIEAVVRAEPTGKYARRVWFLYEWLTGARLKLSDSTMGTYVPAIDPDQQWTIKGKNSPQFDPSRSCPARIQSSGRGLSDLRRHPGPN
jgi:hypothetical protein